MGEEALPWLTTDWVLGQFGSGLGVARARFAAFVEEGMAEGHSEVFYGGQADTRVVGEEDFANAMLRKKARGPKPPSLRAIVAYVCRSASMTEAELKAPGKGRAPAHARALAGWLAVHSKAVTLTQVANHFHRELSTLSHAVSALQERSRKSESFASALKQHIYAISKA